MIIKNEHPSLPLLLGQPRLAIVGHAPASEEFQQNRPFAGPAGRELDWWLKGAGILRSQCFVGNLSQQRAPGDKIGAMFSDKKGKLPKPELQHWIDVLKEELEAFQPNCIVALGNEPLRVLADKWDITKTMGSVYPSTLIPGAKVLAVPHPAWVIRGLFAIRQVMVLFMMRAKEEALTRTLTRPERTLLVDPTLEEVHEALDKIEAAHVFAFDIENPGGKITCISFSTEPGWAVSIPFNKGPSHRWHLEVEADIWRRIARILSGTALKIGHHVQFDIAHLSQAGIYVAPPYWCTEMAHHVCYPDLSRDELKRFKLNSLAFCTALYTHEPYYKSDFKIENEDSPTWRGAEKEFWIYNAKDSVVAYEIYQKTDHDLNVLDPHCVFAHDMELMEPLITMSTYGIKVDTEKRASLSVTVEDKVAEIQAKLNLLAGTDLNVNSPKQMFQFLYNDLNMPIQYAPDTGRPTADETAIAKLQKTFPDSPILPIIVSIRRLAKLKSTYLETTLSPDGRFRTSYNQARTTTFRLSSSKSPFRDGGNVQNIPARPRGWDTYDEIMEQYKCTFVADEGMLMGRRDYKQAEAMVVAWLAKDQQQMHDFLSGIDTHCRAAEILFGHDYQKILDAVRNGNPEFKMMRRFGKTIRHGRNYKLGKRKLRGNFLKEGVDVPERECGRMLDAMSASTPAVTHWHEQVEAELHKTRVLVTPLGRRRYFMGFISADVVREGIAFVPQCTVGQMTNISIVRIYRELGMELDLLINGHDAVYWQSPTDRVEAHAHRIERLMEIPLAIHGEELLIPSDLAIGPSWGELEEVK